MFGLWVFATLWHKSLSFIFCSTLSYISRTTDTIWPARSTEVGFDGPLVVGCRNYSTPSPTITFKLCSMIHLQQFGKTEGNRNAFLLKAKSNFSGSRQWLKFRHQLFFVDICSDAADRPAALHHADGKLQICTLDVTWLLQNGQFIPAFKSLTGQGLRGDYLAAAGGSRAKQKLPSACERTAPFSILTKRTWATHTHPWFHLPCRFIPHTESSLTSCVSSLMQILASRVVFSQKCINFVLKKPNKTKTIG